MCRWQNIIGVLYIYFRCRIAVDLVIPHSTTIQFNNLVEKNIFFFCRLGIIYALIIIYVYSKFFADLAMHNAMSRQAGVTAFQLQRSCNLGYILFLYLMMEPTFYFIQKRMEKKWRLLPGMIEIPRLPASLGLSYVEHFSFSLHCISRLKY